MLIVGIVAALVWALASGIEHRKLAHARCE
jgi:hypothetical protein